MVDTVEQYAMEYFEGAGLWEVGKMRTTEVLRNKRIPNFEREILPVFEERFAHIFSLNGDRMERALEEAYRIVVDYEASNLSEEEFDERLEELEKKYRELGLSTMQTKGIAYLGVMVKLVTGENLTDLE